MKAKSKMSGRRMFNIGSVVAILLLCVFIFADMMKANYTEMSRKVSVSIACSRVILLSLTVIFVFSALDKNDEKQRGRGLFLMLIASLFMEEFFSSLAYIHGYDNPGTGICVIITLSYLFLYLLIVTYSHYLHSQIKIIHKRTRIIIRIIDCLFVAGGVALILNIPLKFIFSAKADGLIQGPLAFLLWVVPALSLLDSFNLAIMARDLRNTEKFAFFAFTLLPAIAVVLTAHFPNVFLLDTALFISVIILYASVYSQRGIIYAKQDMEVANLKTMVMMSQIQPHFLFNALNSIYYLTGKDTKLAQKAINDFSDYLRVNLDSINKMGPIPFEKELNHIATYLWIEKLRFEDDLTIVYDIQAKDFNVPVLSIQPLVENAVRHGICGMDEGGTLYIRTVAKKNHYEIVIQDTGAGFDVNRPIDNAGIHVGIENTRKRLWHCCEGTLAIESKIGEGTTCTVRIPKKVEK